MPETGVRRSIYLDKLHHHAETQHVEKQRAEAQRAEKQQADRKRARKLRHEPHEPVAAAELVNITAFKAVVEKLFTGDLAAAVAFTDDTFIADLVDRVNTEGLTLPELAGAIGRLHQQISVQANFEARQQYLQTTSQDGIFDKIRRSLYRSLREAGELVGWGVTTDVIKRKKQILGLAEDPHIGDEGKRAASVQAAQADLKALVESSVQMEVMRHRFGNYLELGGAPFVRVVRDYQSGKLDHQKLFEQTAFTAGLEKVVQGFTIPDDFELEEGEPPVNTRELDVKEAIRRHLKFVLRTEIVHLAELQQLEVLSSEAQRAEETAEIDSAWQRRRAYLNKVGAAVFFSGTTWGVLARTGTKLVIGGLIAAHAPAALGIAGGIFTGVVAGAAAGAVRERCFNSKDRRKRQRMEAALGAIDKKVVVSAEDLHDELNEKATELQKLQAEIAAGKSKQSDLDQAVKELYAVVADVQVRLLRARAGNDAARDYSDAKSGHNRRRGYGFGAGGKHNASHVEKIDHTWKVPVHGERQDYISFGVANRVEAQQRLLLAFESALVLVEQTAQADPAKAAGWKVELDKIYKQANKDLDDAQIALEARMKTHNRAAVVRSSFIGAAGGAIGVVAMETLGVALSAVWEEVQPLVATLRESEYFAELDDPVTGVMAELSSDGAVHIYKGKVELAQTQLLLPDGVGPHDITLEFEGGNLAVYEAATGKDLGLLKIEVSQVTADNEVLRNIQLHDVNLAVQRPYTFAVADVDYSLAVDSHGIATVSRLGGTTPEPLGDGFSLVDNALKAQLADAEGALQFFVHQMDDEEVVIYSVFDGTHVAAVHLPESEELSVDMRPLTLERVFIPVGGEQAILDNALTVKVDSALAQAVGGVFGDSTEAALQELYPRPEIGKKYSEQEGDTLAQKVGYYEYPEAPSDYPATELPPISEIAALVKDERLTQTRPERSRLVLPELAKKVKELSMRMAGAKSYAELLTTIKAKGLVDLEDYQAATALVNVTNDARDFLTTNNKDGDLDYAAIDRELNDDKFKKFIARIEGPNGTADLAAALEKNYGEQITRFTTDIETIRSKPDTERTPSQRLAELQQKRSEFLALYEHYSNFVMTALATVEYNVLDAEQNIEYAFQRSMAPLEIIKLVQVNADVCKALVGELQKAKLLDDDNQYSSTAQGPQLFRLRLLASDLAKFQADKSSLQRLGLLGTATPEFAAPQRGRIEQIVKDLVADDDTYLEKDLVKIAEPAQAAARAKAPVTKPEPASASATASAPETGGIVIEGLDLDSEY